MRGTDLERALVVVSQRDRCAFHGEILGEDCKNRFQRVIKIQGIPDDFADVIENF